MCKCTEKKVLDLAWEVERLTQENERLKAQCEGIRVVMLRERANNDRLLGERDQAIKTRNLAQARSSADAIEKQQLREQLAQVEAALA